MLQGAGDDLAPAWMTARMESGAINRRLTVDERRVEEGRPEAETREGVPATQKDSWGRQIVGALIGGGIVLVLGAVAQRLGWIGGNLTRYALWGGMVGALFGGSETLERAGHGLTKRDVAWLNITVSLIGMAVIGAMIYGLAHALVALLRAIF